MVGLPQITPICSLDDPLAAPFRNLKDRELAASDGRFIAEGEFVVRRLLRSAFPTELLLLAERRIEEIAPLAPAGTLVLSATQELINAVVGYKFHSGILACGRRLPSPSLRDILSGVSPHATFVICPELANVENLGSMIRLAAGFGAPLVLGERSADPFFRLSIRVSMGTVFSLPIVRSNDLLADLSTLKQAGMELFATVLNPSGESLETVERRGPIGLVFGNEAQGLDLATVEACDRRVTIPMGLGTDSLNVTVAAGIFLYHFTRGVRR